MTTRALESKDLLRASVTRAEWQRQTSASLTLRTTAVMAAKRLISSADSAMLDQQQLAQVGQTVTGCWRLDVLADHVLRVRYAEGDAVPENPTPMVTGRLPGPSQCRINRRLRRWSAGLRTPPWIKATVDPNAPPAGIGLDTSRLRVRLNLDPFRMEICDRTGRALGGVGGPEKDNFCNWDSYNTGICRARADGRPIAVENFDLAHDECIYGFGEKFIKLNKVGQTIDLDMVDALGVTTPRSYKNVPFYVSTRGYGVFFNHSCRLTYWVGSLSAADVQVAVEDDFLDYFIIAGNIKEVLHTYTALTGRGELPPQWTFGYWQSKISYQSADETLTVARELRRHQVPCDVIHLDTHWFAQDWFCNLEFAKDRFPDPAGYLEELGRLGFKVSLWQLPYIPAGSALFDALAAVGGFVKNAQGEIYDCGICFTKGFKGVVGVVDYTNPAAVRVHQEYFRRLFRLGVKVIKTDFGEAAPADGVYHDGTPGHRMHNLYPLLYNQALSAVTRAETGSGVVWARSAWAGSQRYPLHWGGDNSPNHFNMLPQLEGGLSFGLSGFQFWSQDIGGFCGAIDEALLIRWMQLGLFQSHSRIHGFGDRELYKFSKRTMGICREYIRLRYRLLPYIYGSARQCLAHSVPMARPLVVEFQDDPTVWNMSDEFLFGDSLLVAPIFDQTDRRRVYLPAGDWYDWWTRKRLTGPRWLEVKAPLDRLPLYVREGAVIPLGPVLNYVDEKPVTQIELRVAPFAGSGHTEFLVPVNGAWVPVTYRASNGRHRVRTGKTDVKFVIKPLGRVRIGVGR